MSSADACLVLMVLTKGASMGRSLWPSQGNWNLYQVFPSRSNFSMEMALMEEMDAPVSILAWAARSCSGNFTHSYSPRTSLPSLCLSCCLGRLSLVSETSFELFPGALPDAPVLARCFTFLFMAAKDSCISAKSFLSDCISELFLLRESFSWDSSDELLLLAAITGSSLESRLLIIAAVSPALSTGCWPTELLPA